MTDALSTPIGMKAVVTPSATATFRAQAGRRVMLRLLDNDEMRLEGALRHATDDHVEFWSRVAWRQVEAPRAAIVSVMLEKGLWASTGIAQQGTKTGAVTVVLDHPLVPADRRRNPRYQVSLPVTLLIDRRVVMGRTLDVSIGGLRLVPEHAAEPIPAVGRWGAVSLDVGGQQSDGAFVGLAIVRSSDATSWRMEFSDLPQRMTDILSNLIRQEVRAGATVEI